MKLKKDEFKRSEIDAAGEKIVGLLIDYTEKNQLKAFTTNYSTNLISLSEEPIRGTQPVSFKKFIKEQFKFMDEDLMPSHTISFHSHHRMKFYVDAMKKLNNFEKVVLIKTMFCLTPSFRDLDPSRGFISEQDYWLHLRNISPFTKIRQKQHSDDVRTVLESIGSLEINTQEKVNSLAYFLNYYKVIAKRTDIKAGLIRLLKHKVNEDHYPLFESILSTKISNGKNDVDIFVPAPEVKLLIVSKDSLFEQIPFANIPQAQTHNYNQYLEFLNRFLQSPEASSILNIARIDYHELTATKEPARVYIQAKEGGFKQDIQEIYKHLIKSCSDSFPSPLIDNAFKTSLNYFLLQKEINEDNELKEEQKKRVMKV